VKRFYLLVLLAVVAAVPTAFAQGVTRAGLSGFVFDLAGEPLPGANVVAVHQPTGTTYGAATTNSGAFQIPNVRVGGPYTVTASYVAFEPGVESGLFLSLGQTTQLEFRLAESATELDGLEVTAESDDVLNADRTGAATAIGAEQVAVLPTVSRSTRDLTRVDPRSDGNFSFGGRNWLYNNVTLDGSYFNNPFGLDDPAPGGQAGAEPVPYDAIEQVQVSIAPFDVRESGFTGASVNQVTRSGTNSFRASAYTFYRDENLIGNTVSGQDVLANPDLRFGQYGLTVGGPILRDKLFFFVAGELSRREDPGSNFVASRGGDLGLGVSRPDAAVLDQIRQRLIDGYDYDPGAYEGYVFDTDNNKLLAKLDWNINRGNRLTFRYSYLDSYRDLNPNAFAISISNAGRGPNPQSLPFQNAGYRINNDLQSFAAELNSNGSRFANRLFASYNRFRDSRDPFSEPFPTLEIGQDEITYTTAGHEPFSIHNILDQDVVQVTNNFSYFLDRHVLTAGANFEYFSFFNSFNLFRHGLFQLPYNFSFGADGLPSGNTFPDPETFLAVTNPDLPFCTADDVEFFENSPPIITGAGTTCRLDFRSQVTPGDRVFKGERISVGQVGFYLQDEFNVSPQLKLTGGIRVDFPLYFSEPEDNPYGREITTLDEDYQEYTLEQADLPGATPLLSPRVGFNWDVRGDRTTQLRGGTGIFTGRIPFVWLGNVISNPGLNPNLPGEGELTVAQAEAAGLDIYNGDSTPTQSFDLNAMDEDFRFPQVWTTNLAVDQALPYGVTATLEGIFGKDINAVTLRNADLPAPTGTLESIGGRPSYASSELNADDGRGIYVIGNTDEGYNLNVTAQLRKQFGQNIGASMAYSYTRAENVLKTTEIASVLWQNNPVQRDPNNPELGFAEFGQPHRFIGTMTYRREYGGRFATSMGLFATVAKGNQYLYNGGNRYSFTYAGDVNGDGYPNDLLYVPTGADDVQLTDPSEYAAFDALIENTPYLAENRGEIVERFGLVNPWYMNVDLKLLQDITFDVGGKANTLQLSLDVLNVANLLSSDWGVRKVANPAALSPLAVDRFDADGEPVFDYVGPTDGEAFVDDVSEFSRWRMQFGVRYLFGG
jgi:hypothetical protein